MFVFGTYLILFVDNVRRSNLTNTTTDEYILFIRIMHFCTYPISVFDMTVVSSSSSFAAWVCVLTRHVCRPPQCIVFFLSPTVSFPRTYIMFQYEPTPLRRKVPCMVVTTSHAVSAVVPSISIIELWITLRAYRHPTTRGPITLNPKGKITFLSDVLLLLA